MRRSLLPYFSAPEIRVGPLHLSTQSVCMVGAVLLAYAMAARRARRLGLDPSDTSAQYVCAVACGVVCGNLAPFLLLPAGGWRQGGIALGGLWGSLSGAAVWMWLRRLPASEWPRRLDLFAYVAPFAWSLARLGCALAHDHPGIRSRSFLAVRFPGGPRYDLGLLEMLLAIGVAALFAALGRRERTSGLYFGWCGLLYGAFRLAIEPLRAEPASAVQLFDRIAAGASVAVGLAILTNATLSHRHYLHRLRH
jgi:phosphatidylglycerol---prolipoprotein diacylglyceryl transferase